MKGKNHRVVSTSLMVENEFSTLTLNERFLRKEMANFRCGLGVLRRFTL